MLTPEGTLHHDKAPPYAPCYVNGLGPCCGGSAVTDVATPQPGAALLEGHGAETGIGCATDAFKIRPHNGCREQRPIAGECVPPQKRQPRGPRGPRGAHRRQPHQQPQVQPPIPPPPIPTEKRVVISRGSKNHHLGQCRPCHFNNRPEDCPDGALCNFCHYEHSTGKMLEMAVFSVQKQTRRAHGRDARAIEDLRWRVAELESKRSPAKASTAAPQQDWKLQDYERFQLTDLSQQWPVQQLPRREEPSLQQYIQQPSEQRWAYQMALSHQDVRPQRMQDKLQSGSLHQIPAHLSRDYDWPSEGKQQLGSLHQIPYHLPRELDWPSEASEKFQVSL